ncbi:MAG: hypothetical protein JSV93_01225 [Candidatus Omnitrophota bacterium]|nr:MAG: hypothetical protein JSV93_01225 [Candidatus Omnitrophota bacterium]
MGQRIEDFVKESRIVAFFANFDKNLLKFFYESGVYKCFLKINVFFKDVFLKNTNKSIILISIKKIIKNIHHRDIGLFVLLVTLFNTLAMIVLKKEIDIFSISARMFFLILGIFLVFKRK